MGFQKENVVMTKSYPFDENLMKELLELKKNIGQNYYNVKSKY